MLGHSGREIVGFRTGAKHSARLRCQPSRLALWPARGQVEQRRVEVLNRLDAQEAERLVDLLVEELEDSPDARLTGGEQWVHVGAAEQDGLGAERNGLDH